MVKGRRAADRRREREQAAGVDPHASTREVTSVSPGQFDPRAETVLNAGEAPPSRPPVGGEGDLAEDTARLGSRAEVTAIREAPDKPPLYGGRLTALAGPDLGLDLIIELTPSVVGRKGDVRLTDPTVSRAHVELRFDREDNTWVLEDLGSTSGTLLNGALLEMPTELSHGDVIAVGQSELRFSWAERTPADKPAVEPEEPPKERTRTGFRLRREEALTQTKTLPKRPEDEVREQRQRRQWIAVAAACALVVLLGGGAAAYFAFFHGRQDPAQVEAQVKALLDEARRHTDDGDLAGARARLDAVLALAPGHAEAESLLRMLDSDVEAARALNEARALFEAGKVEEALAKLRFIPDSSRFAEGREALKVEADERAQKASVRRVEARIDAGDLDGAARLLEEHLARWPKDVFANAMRERIAKLRNAPPPEDPVVAKARDAFHRGDAMEARVLVEQAAGSSSAAKRYLDELDTFERRVAEGRALLGKKDKRAAAVLDEAYALLSRLGRRGKSPVEKRLANQLADALYLDAIAAKQRGDQCAWAEKIHRAVGLAGRDTKLQAQRRAVDAAAAAALTRAEARAGHDAAGAREIASGALCLASFGSDTHRELKRLAR